MRAHLTAAFDLVDVDRSRVIGARVRPHPVERPRQVDGGRPGAAEDVVGLVEIVAAGGCERDAVRRRDADRRGAAHDHRADRFRDLGRRRAPDLDFRVRKPTLVEQDDRVGFQAQNAFGLDQVPSFQVAR
jgi:hypothetical protein